MKKTYMKPELEAIELKINTTILAGSLALSDDDAPISGEDYISLGHEDEFDFEDDFNEFEDFE